MSPGEGSCCECHITPVEGCKWCPECYRPVCLACERKHAHEPEEVQEFLRFKCHRKDCGLDITGRDLTVMRKAPTREQGESRT